MFNLFYSEGSPNPRMFGLFHIYGTDLHGMTKFCISWFIIKLKIVHKLTELP